MNEKTPFPQRVSPTETGAIDYKARKRIEELFSLTDEILRERSYETVRYDKKLYKKYKEVKEMNKKLQEKLLDYHCTGCQCRHSSNPPVAPAVQVIPSSNVNLDNNRKLISELGVLTSNRNVSQPIERTTNQQDDLIIIDEIRPRPKRQLADDNGRLPESLQKVIRTKLQTHHRHRNYLLRIGLYPILCQYLSDCSPSSFYKVLTKPELKDFLQNQVYKTTKLRKKLYERVAEEMKEIHQNYLLQFMEKPVEEETIGQRKRKYHRRVVRK